MPIDEQLEPVQRSGVTQDGREVDVTTNGVDAQFDIPEKPVRPPTRKQLRDWRRRQRNKTKTKEGASHKNGSKTYVPRLLPQYSNHDRMLIRKKIRQDIREAQKQ